MIGEGAKQILAERFGDEIAHQVGDMVAGAVDRAIKQLSGAMPERGASLHDGGTYRSVQREQDSLPAQEIAIPPPPGRRQLVSQPESPRVNGDAKPRSGDDSLSWVF